MRLECFIARSRQSRRLPETCMGSGGPSGNRGFFDIHSFSDVFGVSFGAFVGNRRLIGISLDVYRFFYLFFGYYRSSCGILPMVNADA